MKKIGLMLIAILTATVFLNYGTVYGQCPWSGKSAGKDEVINKTCPVMGRKVDNTTPYRETYKGKTVGFCCAGCVKEFKKDPDKYMEKAWKEKCAIKCPKCGTEINITEECKKQGVCPMD